MQKMLTNENPDFEAQFRWVLVNFLKLSGYVQVSYLKELGNSVWLHGGFKNGHLVFGMAWYSLVSYGVVHYQPTLRPLNICIHSSSSSSTRLPCQSRIMG